jgi:uncharacterized repeat protein (TIGR03803 family)
LTIVRGSQLLVLCVVLAGCSTGIANAPQVPQTPARAAASAARTATFQSLRSAGHKSSYQILYNFQGLGSTDGVSPMGRLIEANGNLYGTTEAGTTVQNPGCVGGCGIVYDVNIASGQETVLYNFLKGGGTNPQAGLTLVNGSWWGTTVYGGGSAAAGAVFNLNGSGGQGLEYNFAGMPDGSEPYAELLYDGNGTLYGTTTSGGTHNYGTVFKISTSGQETVLYSFGTNAQDAAFPYGGLVFDNKGDLYGTTIEGGAHSGGAIFKITPRGKESVIYSFACGTDACSPYDTLAYDGKSHFYGVSYSGGTNDYGTLFKVSRSGKESVIYRFQGGSDGANPYGSVAYDGHGHVYGTTRNGGGQGFQNNAGTIFEVTVGSGKETVLHYFTGDPQNQDYDGESPVGGMLYDGQGHIFGTTVAGGIAGNGTVFEVTL